MKSFIYENIQNVAKVLHTFKFQLYHDLHISQDLTID